MTVYEHKKNLMIIRNVDSDMISEAYFILKSDIYEKESEEKISEEAERILRECDERIGKGKKALPHALLCFLIGAGIFALTVFLAFLCVQFSM
ncbi:MAG: hypothetical protein E7608_05345 [Ruminococcaceae bacterium]|nr:hypothetical protein [Oscillospiraceae bacterium]